MKYNAVIFDLDGTLVHTTPEYRYQIVGQTLKDFGATSSNQNIDRFWFETRRDQIIKENFGLEPEQFWKTYRKYDTTELRKQLTKVYDDVNYVQELKMAGCKTGIVTGAPLPIAMLEIDMLGKENFDAIVVAHRLNGFMPKPHPQGLESCLELLGVNKSKAVYVGNADEDVETAKNAHVFDVLLLRGEYEFQDIKSSMKIYSLYELRNLLEI